MTELRFRGCRVESDLLLLRLGLTGRRIRSITDMRSMTITQDKMWCSKPCRWGEEGGLQFSLQIREQIISDVTLVWCTGRTVSPISSFMCKFRGHDEIHLFNVFTELLFETKKLWTLIWPKNSRRAPVREKELYSRCPGKCPWMGRSQHGHSE